MIGIALGRWGPACWRWLHGSSISSTILRMLPGVLPCRICAAHMLMHMAQSPPEESDDTAAWLIEFHSAVNARKSGEHSSSTSRAVDDDVRYEYLQFVWAAIFVHGNNANVAAFIRQTCSTVGLPIELPESRCNRSFAEQLFVRLRDEMIIYPTFADLVMDFVPRRYAEYGFVAEPPVTEYTEELLLRMLRQRVEQLRGHGAQLHARARAQLCRRLETVRPNSSQLVPDHQQQPLGLKRSRWVIAVVISVLAVPICILLLVVVLGRFKARGRTV